VIDELPELLLLLADAAHHLGEHLVSVTASAGTAGTAGTAAATTAGTAAEVGRRRGPGQRGRARLGERSPV
jgi:hypothetical protein